MLQEGALEDEDWETWRCCFHQLVLLRLQKLSKFVGILGCFINHTGLLIGAFTSNQQSSSFFKEDGPATAQQKQSSSTILSVAQEVSPMSCGTSPGVKIHSGPSKGRLVQSLCKAIHGAYSAPPKSNIWMTHWIPKSPYSKDSSFSRPT